MADEKKGEDNRTELSVGYHPETGMIGASIKVPDLVWLAAPTFAARREGFKAAVRAMNARLAAGVSPGDLAADEQRLYQFCIGDALKATANQVSVVEKACQEDSEVARLIVEAPRPPLLAAITGTTPQYAGGKSPFDDKARHWFEQLWAVVGSISDPAIQEWFAKLLAGQLKNPGRFSLKALDVLRTMDEDTAQLFHRFRGFIVPAYGFPMWDDRKWSELGLRYGELMDLADVGLVDRMPSGWELVPGEDARDIAYQRWFFRLPPVQRTRQIHGYRITRAGVELLAILDPDDTKFEFICRWFHSQVGDFEVSENGEGGPFAPWVDSEKKNQDFVG